VRGSFPVRAGPGTCVLVGRSPNVETTITRPNPVGDVTKCRIDTSVLSVRHTRRPLGLPYGIRFVFYDTGYA
jgi:hypothetical protein